MSQIAPTAPLQPSHNGAISRRRPSLVTRDVPRAGDERLAWFDYAKGLCILMVAMMHSTLGVEKALGSEGFMHWVVVYSAPFRMPDFFLLAGLFAASAIAKDWRTLIDRKLVHFLYFYLLWLIIQLPTKNAAQMIADPASTFELIWQALLQPQPTLWFIYVLPLFFIATKLLRRLPHPIVWLAAAAVHLVPWHTGWQAIDEYSARYFVFFLSGYMLAPLVFRFTDWVRQNLGLAATALGVWLVFNGAVALSPSGVDGYAHVANLPVVDIAVGLIGAFAVAAIAVLLSRTSAASLVAYAGRNSLVIYTGFVIPMAVTRIALIKSGLIVDPGVVSLIVWISAFTLPLAMFALLKDSPLAFLYRRPEWLRFERSRAARPARAVASSVAA